MLPSAKVLLANGAYRGVTQLRPGDLLATIDRTPNIVKNVCHRRLRPNEEVVSIKHDGWYTTSGISGSACLMTMNEDAIPKWHRADIFTDNQTRVVVLPPKMKPTKNNGGEDDDVEEADVAFAAGFVTGSFMRIGALRTYPEVSFVYDWSSKIGDTLSKYANKAFNVVGTKSSSGHIRRLSFVDRTMWATFYSMGAYGNRRLAPIENNSIVPFASGLNTGIVASGYAGLPPLGEALYETLYWSALHCDRPLCYGQHVYMIDDVAYNACYGRAIVVEKGVETLLYDVFVEPCRMNQAPTPPRVPSLIIGNLVVTAANARGR